MAIDLSRCAQLIVRAHVAFDDTCLVPAVYEFGFERVFQLCEISSISICAHVQPITAEHLKPVQLYTLIIESTSYLFYGSPSLSSEQVKLAQEEALQTLAPQLVKAFLPLINSKEKTVRYNNDWSRLFVFLCDIESTANAFGEQKGFPIILQAITAYDRSPNDITILLIALQNVGKFPSVSSNAVLECSEVQYLPSLLSHSDRTVSWRTCVVLAHFCAQSDLRISFKKKKEVLDSILDNILDVARTFNAKSIICTGFNETDLKSEIQLTSHDYHISIRTVAALRLSSMAQFASDHESSNTIYITAIQKANAISTLRELATEPDAFLYMAAILGLSALKVHPPKFQDNSRSIYKAVNDSSKLIKDWSNEDVYSWVGKSAFKEYQQNFRNSLVSGAVLVTLTNEDLVELGVSKPLHRKAISTAIQNLIKQDSQSSIKDSLSRPTFLSDPVSPQSIRGSSAVTHQSSSPLRFNPLFVSDEASDKVDVFISYRRATGSVMAQLLKIHLKNAGLTTFLDVENLGQGQFDSALNKKLMVANNVIVVLSENSLDRCKINNDLQSMDFVRKEIAMSLSMGKNIVPVFFDNFTFPLEVELPGDIRGILAINAIKWSHDYQDASIDKILKFLV
jgi:hypothetical protein